MWGGGAGEVAEGRGAEAGAAEVVGGVRGAYLCVGGGGCRKGERGHLFSVILDYFWCGTQWR